MENFDYTKEFLKLKNELHSFIFRLLANRHDTEDVVQETYIKVHMSIDTFKGLSSFKTWVFSIAVNLAKNHLSQQKRWLEKTQDYGSTLHRQSPEHMQTLVNVFNTTSERNYEIKEHIAYCFICINKTLVPKQQICLLLKEVYEFNVSEIMQITGLSEGVVKHAIADARKSMVRIFDGRCSFVSKDGMCHQCTSLKEAFNPEQNAHIQANKLKLVKDGDDPDKSHLLDLRFELIKGINPLTAPNAIVNIFMLENAETWVRQAKEKKLL